MKHIDKYEKRTGSSFLLDWDLRAFPHVFLFENGRILTIGADLESVTIGPSTCDVPTMITVATELASMIGIPVIRTFVLKDPSTLRRLADFTVVKEDWDDKLQRKCWLLERKVN